MDKFKYVLFVLIVFTLTACFGPSTSRDVKADTKLGLGYEESHDAVDETFEDIKGDLIEEGRQNLQRTVTDPGLDFQVDVT